MKSSFYREKWNTLREKPADQNELVRLSNQIAHSFLDYYLRNCRYEEEYIDLLCEMTTFSEDPDLNKPGASALFGIIIESLCDDFEELQTETYNQVMAQVISYCRRIPAGKTLDQKLNEFNIYSNADLLARTQKIRNNGNTLKKDFPVKKILLLSRVTIGADVAITSIILQRMADFFPKAEIVLIGGNKLEEVYGGNAGIKIREVPYSRKGGLLERLSSWHLTLEIIARETESLSKEAFILIDPDSRLSQLGVLPLVPQDRYYFFDSRSHSALNRKMSMAELTNSWLDQLSEETKFCYSNIWAPRPYVSSANDFLHYLKKCGAKKIITVNFGVGGNPRKRVDKVFEENLLLTLLQEPNTVILLDKGFGDQELRSTNALINKIESHGYVAAHTHLGESQNETMSHGMVGVQSSIGEMAALIADSDEFIGYDSACQHIAAASGTPCLTIFAGSNNMRFIRRWSAHGSKACNIVHVDTLTNPSLIDIDDIITRVMHVRMMHNQ